MLVELACGSLHEALWELGIGKLVPRLLIARADHHRSCIPKNSLTFQTSESFAINAWDPPSPFVSFPRCHFSFAADVEQR